MTMKKGKFAVYVRDEKKNIKIKLVSGYLINYYSFQLGAYKCPAWWDIIELSTGTTTGLHVDRLQDIESELNNNKFVLDFLQNLAKNPPTYTAELQKNIQKFYNSR